MPEAMEIVTLGTHEYVEYQGVTYGPGKVAIPVAAAAFLRTHGSLPPQAGDEQTDPLHAFVSLKNAGYHTVEDVQAASDEELLKVPGIGEATLKKLREL